MESKILFQVKVDFIINNVTLISRWVGKKWLFLFCEGSDLCVGQNQMCHLCVGIFLFYVGSFLLPLSFSFRLAPNLLIGLLKLPQYTLWMVALGSFCTPYFVS